MDAKELVLLHAELAARQPTPYCIAGNNGPHQDPETIVRNYSHWLYTFVKCFEWTHNEIYKTEAIMIANALCSRDVRPHGYTFLNRNTPGKDRCNGLIGQAWPIEGLAEAGVVLDVTRYLDTAKELFLLHPQNKETGLWHSVEVDGTLLGQNITRNQQFWFAASGIKLADNTPSGNLIAERLDTFLSNLPNIISISCTGLIIHSIDYHRLPRKIRKWIRNNLYDISDRIRMSGYRVPFLTRFRRNRYNQLIFDKTIGYHAFNLCALATLKNAFPDIAFWNSKYLGKAIGYMNREIFKHGIENNLFAFPYNPVGFEVAYASSVLSNKHPEELLEQMSKWINLQLDKCFCFNSMKMVLNTDDPNTLNARMCELARIDPSLLSEITITHKNIR